MLVGKTRRVDIPHEDGEWVELKELSRSQLHKNRDAQTDRTLKKFEGMSKDVLKAMREAARDDAREAALKGGLDGLEDNLRAEASPTAEYDTEMLLRQAIVRWSCLDEDGQPVEVNPDNIALLDEKTGDWLVNQILGIEDEDEVKKDS